MCLFCNIISKKVPSDIIYEDNLILAFKDISPKANTHILIIPKIHIDNFFQINTDEEWKIINHLMYHINVIASHLNINEFKLLNNCGSSAGQEVQHLHFHLLSEQISK